MFKFSIFFAACELCRHLFLTLCNTKKSSMISLEAVRLSFYNHSLSFMTSLRFKFQVKQKRGKCSKSEHKEHQKVSLACDSSQSCCSFRAFLFGMLCLHIYISTYHEKKTTTETYRKKSTRKEINEYKMKNYFLFEME